MKQNVLKTLAALTFIAVFGINLSVYLTKDETTSSLSVRSLKAEAQGGLTGFAEWWDSEVYDCCDDDCTAICEQTISGGGTAIGGYGSIQTKYCAGTEEECEDGSTVAHCWDCDDDCVPK